MLVPRAGMGTSTAGHAAGLPLTPPRGKELAAAAVPLQLPARRCRWGKALGAVGSRRPGKGHPATPALVAQLKDEPNCP